MVGVTSPDAVDDLRRAVGRPADALVRAGDGVAMCVSGRAVYRPRTPVPPGKLAQTRARDAPVRRRRPCRGRCPGRSRRRRSRRRSPPPASPCRTGRTVAFSWHGEDLQAGTVGIDVGDVHGVAVAESGRAPGLMLPGGRVSKELYSRSPSWSMVADAVDDLVLAVAVDVGGAEGVEALGGDGRELRVGAVPAVRGVVERVRHRHLAAVDVPALLEPACRPSRRRPASSGCSSRGRRPPTAPAVEVGHPGQEAVDPVGRLDPRQGVVAPQQTVVAPARLVVDRLQLAPVAPSKTVRYSGPSRMKPSNSAACCGRCGSARRRR